MTMYQLSWMYYDGENKKISNKLFQQKMLNFENGNEINKWCYRRKNL